MDNPQPIETAPTDGTVILTDAGIVYAFVPSCPAARAWVGEFEWIRCTPRGEELLLDDCHEEPKPTLWAPLPAWING